MFSITFFRTLSSMLFTLVIISSSTVALAEERSGDRIFNSYCIACHISGVANAPKIGSAADWLPHVEKGMDAMMRSAINGIGAMPPRGMCSNCSDDEIQSAIQYMIDKSKE